MKLRKLRKIYLTLPLVVLAVIAAGCNDHKATTSAMCAFVIGDGHDGHDSSVHKVYYPDSRISYDGQTEIVRYVPCNSRNYYINPQGQQTAAGNAIGDRHNPTVAYTKDGTKVKVWSHALWTLNEDTSVMKNKFWPVCLKYDCATSSSSTGSSNFASAGWNGMLGELWGPSQDRAVEAAIEQFGDESWSHPKESTNAMIGTAASNVFQDKVQQEVGYADQLFCGSGNSQWSDPANPGKGEFTCNNVRIIIDSIVPVNTKLSNQVQSTTLNKQRLAKAKDLYGAQAAYWLGLQDTIDKCTDKRTCVFNIGGNSSAIPITAGK
jgi:hypothetical protein